MKRHLLGILAAAALAAPAASAQTSVYATYGGYTQMDAMDCHDGWHGVETAWGSLNVGVDFNVLPNLRIGPSYSFSSTSTHGGSNASHVYYHTILANGKYDYYRNGILTLYGHVGLGAVISHMAPKWDDSYNKGYFAFQVSPVGARVKIAPQCDVVGEVGFGAQGLVQVGFNFNF